MEKIISEIDPISAESPHTTTLALGVVGVSFKTAQIESREELAKRIDLDSISDLIDHEELLGHFELVLLSTCNRLEIYYYGRDSLITETLRRFLGENSSNVYHLRAERAVTHLFDVTAGLDSLVVGEAQILSQVNDALKLSANRALSGEVMTRLFSKAYETARTVRERNPALSSGTNYSVSHAALELIKKEYGDRKPNLLLIGSGKMIRLAIGSIERSDLGAVVLAARKKTIENITADSIVGMDEISRTIAEKQIDVVIAATSADDYVVRAKDVNNISKPLLIIDISVPRNVEPEVGKLPNITLLNIDDLKDKLGVTMDDDLHQKVRDELSHGVAGFSSWLADYEEINPLLSSIRKRAETIREEELANTLSRLPGLTDEQRAIIEKMSQRLIRRFLHDPTLRLKNLSRTEGNQKAKMYAEVVSELFTSQLSEPVGE
ncbi:MAG: glutamyl-tRNA reductase [Nitrososphaerota archaeon]|nr:glutamyl-tRNA reductase [Nitrososphaerota archaeon]